MIWGPGEKDERLTPEEIANKIPAYEGLIFKTATLIEEFVEIDLEEIRQRMRIKVWRALVSYSPLRAKQSLDGYVFSCVVNEKKDILKQVRRYDYHMDELERQAGQSEEFEAQYLCLSVEEVFGRVGQESLKLPATLTELERQVVGLLYEGWMQTEIRRGLKLSARAIDDLVRSIREKMADWRPPASERTPGPTPPLPRVLPARGDAPSPATPPRRAAAHGAVPMLERAAVS